jgi:hypothetical protein
LRELHDILAFRRSHDDIEPDKCAISTADVKQTQCITHDDGRPHRRAVSATDICITNLLPHDDGRPHSRAVCSADIRSLGTTHLCSHDLGRTDALTLVCSHGVRRLG